MLEVAATCVPGYNTHLIPQTSDFFSVYVLLACFLLIFRVFF